MLYDNSTSFLEDLLNPSNSTSTKSFTLSSSVFWPALVSFIITAVCLLVFGLAIHKNWNDNLTPRAANLPNDVLKNALLYYHNQNKNKTNKYIDKLTSFYPTALIIWSYNLTYKQCLQGIPGTGTRNKGWEGPLLKVNLDGVILLKYQTLLFKISLLVAILCTFVLLPTYATAKCDDTIFGFGTCKLHNIKYDTIAFRKTTISNIPDKHYNNNTNATEEDRTIDSTIFSEVFGKNQTRNETSSSNDDRSLQGQLWVVGQTWRIAATVICCLIIYIYTFYLLTCEWIENIALRRIYFLEAGHFPQRMQELNKFAIDARNKNEECNDDKVNDMKEDEEELPPWKTHPEIRETPPSVGIYSVMFELPKSMITYDTEGATPIERQLVATTNFFDEIVPPQDGFSSSVAAVTMIPKASLVAKAWTKWVACEQKLQMLRYIHKRIGILTNQQDELKMHQRGLRSTLLSSPSLLSSPLHQKQENDDDDSDKYEDNDDDDDEETGHVNRDEFGPSHDEKDNNNNDDDDDDDPLLPDEEGVEKSSLEKVETSDEPKFRYEDFDVMEYAKSLGFREEVDNIHDFILGMGIEEFSVFAYQSALLAGGPGLNKKVFNFYSIEKLKEEEEDVLEELKEANDELIEARANVVAQDDDLELPQSGRHDIVHTVVSQEELTINNPEENEKEGETRSSDMSKNDNVSSTLGIRQRHCVGTSSTNYSSHLNSDQWELAQRETFAMKSLQENEIKDGSSKTKTGVMAGCLSRIWNGIEPTVITPKYYGRKIDDEEAKAFVTNLQHPSYAVVTFTSRHSAIIARQCLADGGAVNAWVQVDGIPIYPLADSPPLKCFPRGCMRPVTPTISYTSKKVRRWIVYTILLLFTCFYTLPVNLINNMVLDPGLWSKALSIGKDEVQRFTTLLSGFSQSLIFVICPPIFKFLAYSEGSSSSMEKAEQKAMIFFWYFYIVARFLGQILINGIMQFFNGGGTAEAIVSSGLSDLGRTAPLNLGPTAISFIIFSGGISWPINYLLQAPNFGTSIIRLGWINRMLKGGGPGTEVPYRIYIDSGYIFSCLTALAPVCPLVGTFGVCYYIAISPMLRWLLVFGYRPRFDGGGDKWPKLHHLIISSLLLGQLITALTIMLKGNYLEGMIIGSMIILTLLYNSIILEKFLRPYQDAALLQTRRLHYNSSSASFSWMEREEMRRWLVDCHKASYVPTCLSGGSKNLLTAEPAITTGTDEDIDTEDHANTANLQSVQNLLVRQKTQKGGILRRQRYNIS